MTLVRRSFITGLVSLMAAPAIVRAGSLMQVKGEKFVLPDLREMLGDTIDHLQVGDTLRIRLPNDFVVRVGNTWCEYDITSPGRVHVVTSMNPPTLYPVIQFRNPADNALGLVPAST